jgi:hypothetical protein
MQASSSGLVAKVLFLAGALLLIGGCGPITTVRPDGFVERHYVGYVKVLVPDSHLKEGKVSATDITAVGLRIENGVGIGYFRDREVTTPLDCKVVFLVRDRTQLEETVRLLHTQQGGNNVCAAIY